MGRKLSVAFVLAPNFTLLALSAFVDTLRLAADEGDRSRQILCSWTILSDTMRPVRSSSGISVNPESELQDPKRFDYIVVVGGTLTTDILSKSLSIYLQKAAVAGVPLIGICTGSFVLARLGLMQGRKCCISWFHYEEFRTLNPKLHASSDELFIVDGDRLTCAGGTSVVHLAAHLVQQYCGEAAAQKALRIMIEQSTLPAQFPQPQSSQTPRTRDLRVRKAMLLMERNLESPLSVEFVARHVGLSVRQLERLFKTEIGTSPILFALRLRLANARHRLMHSQESVADIALQSGFVNRSHFTHSFRIEFGETPTMFRSGLLAQAKRSESSSQSDATRTQAFVGLSAGKVPSPAD
jgi:transcriptional regulator GlxA family with amidase domain